MLKDADDNSLNYLASPAVICDYVDKDCLAARIFFNMKNPTLSTNPVYCWRSVTGIFTETTAALCVPKY